jgi:phenylalanyl-tRNA synthetase alpha chain
MAVSERIEELKSEALSAIASSGSTAALEDARVRYLGRSAELTEIKKSIGSLLPRSVKRSAGRRTSRRAR